MNQADYGGGEVPTGHNIYHHTHGAIGLASFEDDNLDLHVSDSLIQPSTSVKSAPSFGRA